MRKIIIARRGNTGNQMFQYMFARMLQFRVPNTAVVGFDMPMWGLKSHQTAIPGSSALRVNRPHRFDMAEIVEHLMLDANSEIHYAGYGQRLEYYGPPDLMASFFPTDISPSAPRFGSDHIVINLRGAEILSGVHADMLPLPLSFYEHVVKKTGLRPVFMGQIDPGHFYFAALRQKFPDAVFLSSRGGGDDFEIMRRASNVVVSISTFSWLATWLSRHAQTIHLPLYGFMNPAQRSDIDLAPVADDRYTLYQCPLRRWQGSDDDWNFIMTYDGEFPNRP